MATPPWLAATAGYKGNAGLVNQFLGAHASSWTYSGNVLQASAATGSGLYQSTTSQYLAQSFTTGSAQTAIGVVNLQVSAVGGSPVTATIPPLVVSLYASSAGLPTGTALASATLPEQAVYSGAFWLPVPLAAAVTASTVYQLVVSPAGSSTAYYAWQCSNQPSGGSTSGDGVTWTAQAYGLMFEVYDQAGTAWPPLYLVDDGGARTTAFTYNAAGQLSMITEQVVSQSGAVLYSQRTLTYSGTTLIGVS